MKRIQNVIVAALFLMGTAAFAQQTPPAQAPSGAGHHAQPAQRRMPTVDQQLQHMTNKLSLTDDQQAKIKPILEDRQTEAKAIWNDSSLSQDERRTKMRALQQSSSAKIRDVLNDDQKTKYDAWQQEMRERMRQRHASTAPPK